MKAYIEKVESETIYVLEKRLVEARTTLAFLIEYTNVSPATMRSNADTFAWYDRMQSIFDEHRAIIAEKQTQFEEALKVCHTCYESIHDMVCCVCDFPFDSIAV